MLAERSTQQQSTAGLGTKKNAPLKGLMAGLAAAMLVFSPLQIGAVELPDGWAASTTEDGREYYYNLETKKSQFALPSGAVESAVSAKAKAKRINDQNNLNKVERFDRLPSVPVDRITVYTTPELDGGCGSEDYRANSVECGTPAKNPVQDVAEKSVETMSILGDLEKGKTKATSSAERDRMLQEAEFQALKKTDLFKKLDAKTKDPEAMAKRKKAIEDITARNDIGASRAPWDPLPKEERPPPIKFEMPKMPNLPNPFGGGKETAQKSSATTGSKTAKTGKKVAPAPAADVEDDQEDEE